MIDFYVLSLLFMFGVFILAGVLIGYKTGKGENVLERTPDFERVDLGEGDGSVVGYIDEEE